MRIPGITKIGYLKTDNLPHDLLLTYLSQQPLNLSLVVNQLNLQGEAECTIEDKDEQNGSSETVSLSFTIEHRLRNRGKLAFVATLADGHSYLIGTREEVPSVTQSDKIAAPDTVNAVDVTVELTASKAWLPLNSIEYEEGQPVPFIQWREATEQEIDDMIDNVEQPSGNINPKILITLRLLDRAFKRFWLKVAPAAHTHTTDQVKMVNDQTKTLTNELNDMKKLIYAGL